MTHSALGDPIRVIIADDHRLYRRSLAAVMSLDGDIEVVGQASDGYEAVDLAVATRPDVIVIDLRMPRLDGIDAARAITGHLPHARILMLTMSESSEHFVQAMAAGVSGYIYKDASGEEVAEAIRSVHRGDRILSPVHKGLPVPGRS